MFANIIPHGSSFGTETLTYFVGDSFVSDIAIWQLVKIPYGKKTIFGIVANIFEDEKFLQKFSEHNELKIKEIEEIVSIKPIFAEYQINMMIRLSKKYIITLHKILSIFLFSSLFNRLQKYDFPLLLQNNKRKNEIKHEIFLTKNDIIIPEKIFPFFKDGIVIILPDDIMLKNFANFLETQEKWRESIFFLPHEITDTRRAQAWIDIFNKKYPIIIWTRRLLQYNVAQYDEIWYIEDAFSWEYYQYPVRMKNLDFLTHMVDSDQFSVKIFTSIPKITTLSLYHFFSLTYL